MGLQQQASFTGQRQQLLSIPQVEGRLQCQSQGFSSGEIRMARQAPEDLRVFEFLPMTVHTPT